MARPRSSKKAAAAARPPLRIVHLPSRRPRDRVVGTAACGRHADMIGTPGWEAHSLAKVGDVVPSRDACLTCRDFSDVTRVDENTLRVGGCTA